MSIRDEDGTTSGSKGAQGPGPQARFDRRRRGVRVTYAAAIALGLAVGGGAVAGAATSSSPSSTTTPSSTHADGPGGGHRFGGTPPAAFGTVASVGANTFTLTAHDGTTVTVNVSGSTTYADPSVTTATFADVKVGDHVAVFGTDTSNTVAATKVAVGGPGGPGGPGRRGPGFGGTPPAAFGTVASVGANTFTLTAHDGTTVTVNVSGSTTYADPSVTTATFADVKVGDHVAVFGTDTSNTVAATKVAVRGPGGPGRRGPGFGGTPPAAFGTVASVGANTFTLTAHDGTTVTVNVSGSTTYADPSVTTATFADVKVGDHVAVFGTDTSNTVAATKVAVGGPRGPGGPGGPGGQFGPGGSHGPDGAGGWSPPSSSSTSPSGAATNGSSTTSNVATTGYTLN